jgi:hypothetical protein
MGQARLLNNPAPVPCQVLILNSVSATSITGGLTVNFTCPVCGATWALTIIFNDYDDSGAYDMDSLVNTTFPDHDDSAGNDCSFSNTQISLFLAAHLDSTGFYDCIQRSDAEGANGIPDGWWQT